MKNDIKPQGFTLIELLIVIVIIGILAAFAFPAYQGHVLKSRRATAEGCLLQYAQLMERFYSNGFTYIDIDGNDTDNGASEVLPSLQCAANDLNDFYTFSLSAVAAQSYTLQGVPDTAKQNDTKCGTLSINQAGVRTESGTASDATECW